MTFWRGFLVNLLQRVHAEARIHIHTCTLTLTHQRYANVWAIVNPRTATDQEPKAGRDEKAEVREKRVKRAPNTLPKSPLHLHKSPTHRRALLLRQRDPGNPSVPQKRGCNSRNFGEAGAHARNDGG